MNQGTFESIRDVIGTFFQHQDRVGSPRSDQSDIDSHENEADSHSNPTLDESTTPDEALRVASYYNSSQNQPVELETVHETTEPFDSLKEPSLTTDTHKWMQESARQALRAIRHSSSLLVYHTFESRIVPCNPAKTAQSSISNHSVLRLNAAYPGESNAQQLVTEQDISKPSGTIEEMTHSVFVEAPVEVEFVADLELLGNIDELPSRDFDELQGDLPDILPALNGLASLDVHETLSSHRNSRTDPSSSASRRSASLYDSESFFPTSTAANISHPSLSPQFSDLATQSAFLAQFEPMFRPLEELPLPYCY